MGWILGREVEPWTLESDEDFLHRAPGLKAKSGESRLTMREFKLWFLRVGECSGSAGDASTRSARATCT